MARRSVKEAAAKGGGAKGGSRARPAKESAKGSAKAADQTALLDALRRHVRMRAEDYLKDPNITSVGVGRKNGDGPISLQFTVGTKIEASPELLGSALQSLGSQPIPKTITVDGIEIPTDVIERKYERSFRLVAPEALGERKSRIDPVRPGASIGNARKEKDAGTIGLIVYDRATGAPCALTNWHVAHGAGNEIGDDIVQPGTFDDNNVAGNLCGQLLRSHLGAAGDCALVRLRAREIDRTVIDLDVVPVQLAEVQLDDRVVKSGRTTGVTHGRVRRVDVVAKLDYTGPGQLMRNVQSIGCFEIGVDPQAKPSDGEISRPGDSGAAWLIWKGGRATDIFAGLHFAGETGDSADEHALACYALSVQKKLDFVLEVPATDDVDPERTSPVVARTGYDPDFLGVRLALPALSTALKRDAVNHEKQQFIPYTHFSVCLSAARRMPRLVAWNVDGARKVVLPRDTFRLDPRVDPKFQLGDELYKDNALDRGHVARRDDLCWGTVDEAAQANRDSFFFTNVAPQHESFNQSKRRGLWGSLENLVLEQAELQGIRVSAMGGPVFGDNDPSYRGARLPKAFWKLIGYRGRDDRLRVACFLLSQANLMVDFETLDFDPFRVHQITVAELSSRTTLDFSTLQPADLMAHPDLATGPVLPEGVGIRGSRTDADRYREIREAADILL